MTTPTSEPLRVPGRLVVNPTNLAAAFPYGGVELGTIQEVTLEPGERRSPAWRAEEFAGDSFDALYLGSDWFATATLSQWTTDTLVTAGVLPGAAAGSGALPLVSYPAAAPAPTKLSARGVILLFVAEHVVQGGTNTDEDALSWLMYRAVPALERPIPFSGVLSSFLFTAWEALPNDDGAVLKLGAFGDLAL